ncbi:MAG: formimidoylglutamase [Bacteroidota bacterium]
MELVEYFKALEIELPELGENTASYGAIFKTYSEGAPFPDMDEVDMVILGIPEERAAYNNEGCKNSPDSIRRKLYSLNSGDYSVRIADIGNLIIGNTIEDTYVAMADVCTHLLKKNIVPIILGGSQDLTYAQYKSYAPLGKMVNIVSVDSHFDLGTNKSDLNSRTYLGKIITDEPNILFNYSNLGFQSYFVGSDAITLMKKLYFDVYRLGQVRNDMEEVEPIIRSSDMLTFDVSSIRYSDAPGNGNSSPNGFYGEEVCQIFRYAGLTEKLTSLGIYEVNSNIDDHQQTSYLVAEMLWYFIDGFYNRKKEEPMDSKDSFVKYRVNVKTMSQELIFYKSKKTDRWWMEIPNNLNQLKYYQNNLIPCSYKDYKAATNDEIPERWWQTFNKFN